MGREIGAGHVAKGSADKYVRREVLLGGIAREAHAGGQRIRAPLDPPLIWVTMGEDAGEGKAISGVSGWKRPSATPKFAGSHVVLWKLPVECELQCEVG